MVCLFTMLIQICRSIHHRNTTICYISKCICVLNTGYVHTEFLGTFNEGRKNAVIIIEVHTQVGFHFFQCYKHFFSPLSKERRCHPKEQHRQTVTP